MTICPLVTFCSLPKNNITQTKNQAWLFSNLCKRQRNVLEFLNSKTETVEGQQNCLWWQKVSAPETGHNSLLPTHRHWKTKPSSSSWHDQHSIYSGELPVCVSCTVAAATEQVMLHPAAEPGTAMCTTGSAPGPDTAGPSHGVPTALICSSGFPHCCNSLGFSKIMVLLHSALQEWTVIKGF